MKVLHYAVFNDQRARHQGVVDSLRYAAYAAIESESSPEGVPSKLSSAAGSKFELKLDSLPDSRPYDRQAQTKTEQFRADILSLTLALIGRQTPADSASSVVDLSIVR